MTTTERWCVWRSIVRLEYTTNPRPSHPQIERTVRSKDLDTSHQNVGRRTPSRGAHVRRIEEKVKEGQGQL